MKEICTEKAPGAIGPYSQAVVSGQMVFTSGQIPVNPATGEISSDVREQARQVFANVSEVLKAAGSSMKEVVKTTVFIKNMEDFAAVNEEYAKFFEQPYPARSCVEAARLPKDVLIEMEAVAVKENERTLL
jgi:2-iminobutanoate/2-iminopropanoate deaminase